MSMIALYMVLVVLPGIETLFSALAVGLSILTLAVFIVGGVITLIEQMWEDEDFSKPARLWIGRWLKMLVVVFVVSVLAPTESQLTKIIGGYVVTNVEGVEKLPENLVNYANEFLTVDEKEPKE